MKLKAGYKWKAIEGISKGKTFVLLKIEQDKITYKSDVSCKIYTAERKYFEKYIERVNKYWSETTKSYKSKKENLKNER